MKKITISDLDDITIKKMHDARNKEGKLFNDLELLEFTVAWENICNKINNKRKGLLPC